VSGEALGFAALAVALMGSSLGVVLARNLFHAVLWLAAALVATAGVFLLLYAEFLAAVQVLLYAGGVVTIVVFAIMLTERLVGETLAQVNRGVVAGALTALAVFGVVAPTVLRAVPGTERASASFANTAALGEALLTKWVLPFEALAVLFVAALLGALCLARVDD
jgi:NADH:ubiquinone oxidoreductase subunit 6 (subunit J)